MTDASHIKVHPHAAGAKGGNQGMNHTEGGQHKIASGRGYVWHAGQNYYLCKVPQRIVHKLPA
ncbi:hypothetical protein SAMN05428952_100685 [Nitrosomonas sp. Nm132]|nr:hypothetical protein SAMN05428952_100685 [Nitrosomonas sp. Nm132]